MERFAEELLAEKMDKLTQWMRNDRLIKVLATKLSMNDVNQLIVEFNQICRDGFINGREAEQRNPSNE